MPRPPRLELLWLWLLGATLQCAALPLPPGAHPATPRCFGGDGWTAADHVATYGHASSAGCTGIPESGSRNARRGEHAGSELVLHTRGKGGSTATQRWNGSETAMVIIDMWSYHPCKTVTNRAGALVPRLNAVAAAVRASGGLVLFAPTDASEVYSGWPQRERVFQTPHVTPIFQNISVPSLASGLIAGDDDECSDAGHGCVWNYGEARQNPAIVIEPSDYIVGGDTNPIDVYSVLTHHGIKNVLHAGIAENICVQAKCEGIPTLTKLGFNCALMRDLTDAQSHYEPQTYRGPNLPWVHMDWGTKNVTKSIEDQGIAVTVEGAALAVAAGAWPQSPPDPVLHAPWGTIKRPQIFDGTQTVTLSTVCDMEAQVGCETPYEIRYTLDGSDPSVAGSTLYSHPFSVSTNVTVRAVGLSPGGKAPVRFAESQSVLVRRELSPELMAAASTTKEVIPALMKQVQLEISQAAILWNFGDDAAYRQQPVVNNSWIGHPLSFRNLKSGLVGLGLKAPMHLNFNVTQLRKTLPELNGFVVAAAIDGGCDIGGAYGPGAPLDGFNHVYNCHDIAEWQHARVKIYVDGVLRAESPTLQSQGLEWLFNVTLGSTAEVLRVVAMPADRLDPDYGSELAGQQDAYDWVDLVGGFV